MKITVSPHMKAFPTSRALPWASLMALYAMTPAATPVVMVYVKGIRTTVRKTGMATERSLQSTCRAFCIIIAPMTTRAAEATSVGTIAVSRVKKEAGGEEEAGDGGGETGTGPFADAGGRFDETVWPEPEATPPMTPPAPSMNSA